VLSIFIPRRLFHIYVFLKNTMKKHVLHIQLSNSPPSGDSNRQDQSNSSRFYHWMFNVILYTKSI
jgi:hypothetical protein